MDDDPYSSFLNVVPFFVNYSANIGSMFCIVHNFTQMVVLWGRLVKSGIYKKTMGRRNGYKQKRLPEGSLSSNYIFQLLIIETDITDHLRQHFLQLPEHYSLLFPDMRFQVYRNRIHRFHEVGMIYQRAVHP